MNEKELAPKNNISEEKPDLSLIPMDLLKYLARAYEYGAKGKYYRNSWRKGFTMSNSVRATREHLKDFWELGLDYDAEAMEKGFAMHHIASAIFNLISILDAFENHPELDDRHKKPEIHRVLEEQEIFIKKIKEIQKHQEPISIRLKKLGKEEEEEDNILLEEEEEDYKTQR